MAGAQYTGDYLSLLLVNGSLIFTYSLGSGDRSHNLHTPHFVELSTVLASFMFAA